MVAGKHRIENKQIKSRNKEISEKQKQRIMNQKKV